MAPISVGVVFNLVCAETEPGEEIALAGASAVLGGWDPERAVSLSTNTLTFPKWSTNVLWFSLPSPAALPLRLEYKYLRDRRKLGGSLSWEESIPNRSVCISSCSIEVAWLVHDMSWESLEVVLHQGLAPALKAQPEACLKRQISPEWSGGPEDAEAGDDDDSLRGELFTPTCRTIEPATSMCSLAWGSLAPPEMAREESATSLHRWSASSLAECQNETPAGNTDLAPPGTGMRKNTSVSLLPDSPQPECPCEDADRLAPTASALAFEATYAIVGEKPLGEGSFGLVWSCRLRSSAMGNPGIRAVKRIRKALLKPRDIDNLFGRDGLEGEIHMHLRLKHPHVVAMHEVFNAPTIVSLVMECCEGGDLFDLITASRLGLPESSAARALRHLLSALAFLHGLLIVHRDVKCENLLCAERGLPIERSTFKLCDFGFAASLRAAGGQLRTRLGSPDAVAPEVVIGARYSTPVDCWAAGVLLYMSLSASSPFWDKTDAEVLRKVKKGEYKLSGPKWDRISCEAKDVVRQLLTYNPSVRITAQRALGMAWVAGTA
mmetsp:Transcript_12846/g.36505  ORF Transcript_12846/g.36505 Transcript_12846/m.36505 type:complete len:549 (-) Transcript_12846:389-2035(-)